MSDPDDEFEDEPECPKCQGKGWIAPFRLRYDCDYCERTGVDLIAAGYKDPEYDDDDDTGEIDLDADP